MVWLVLSWRRSAPRTLKPDSGPNCSAVARVEVSDPKGRSRRMDCSSAAGEVAIAVRPDQQVEVVGPRQGSPRYEPSGAVLAAS